jgi:phosphatidylinositol 4-kinase
MEAKLANLQSRKPADEDYVPGLGIDSNFNAPRRDVSASLPASGATTPADLEKDLDEEMGLDAATKAADELEKEFGLEIAGRQVSVDSERERSRERTGSVDHHTTREGSAPIGREERSPVKEPREEEKRKQQLYQKGLASLPKKPSFL